MGLDFMRKAAKSFTKSWDRGVSELARPTLFTRHPECRTRSVIALLDENTNFPTGTQLTAWIEPLGLRLVYENAQVGRIDTPPEDLLIAIRNSGGCALAEITQINHLSGTANVEIK